MYYSRSLDVLTKQINKKVIDYFKNGKYITFKAYYLVIYCSLLWVARVSSLVLDRNYRNGEMTDYKIKRDQHMKTTDAHRREDIVNNQTYVLVQIPDDIKTQLRHLNG